MAKDVVLTLFRHSTDGHLFLSLMSTIRNGYTFVVVLNAGNGAFFVCFHLFYVDFVCLIKGYMYFCSRNQKEVRL